MKNELNFLYLLKRTYWICHILVILSPFFFPLFGFAISIFCLPQILYGYLIYKEEVCYKSSIAAKVYALFSFFVGLFLSYGLYENPDSEGILIFTSVMSVSLAASYMIKNKDPIEEKIKEMEEIALSSQSFSCTCSSCTSMKARENR